MYKVSKFYDDNKSEKIKISVNGDFYDLEVDGEKTKAGYDNIYTYGDNLFVLISKGKMGAVQYDKDLKEIYFLPCEYDMLDNYWHNLLFSNKNEIVYYNCTSKEWKKLTDGHISDGFLYAEDEHAYLIIELDSGRVIWNQYKKSEHLVCEPCYVFCGRSRGMPEFYDISNHDYISDANGQYARYKMYELIKPIIINGENVVGICEKNDKLGLIEPGKRKSVVPQWDEATVELKVILKDGNRKHEAVYHMGDFKVGDVIPIEEW